MAFQYSALKIAKKKNDQRAHLAVAFLLLESAIAQASEDAHAVCLDEPGR